MWGKALRSREGGQMGYKRTKPKGLDGPGSRESKEKFGGKQRRKVERGTLILKYKTSSSGGI